MPWNEWQRDPNAEQDAIEERRRKGRRAELQRYAINPAGLNDRDVCLALGEVACKLGERLRGIIDRMGISDATACEDASALLGFRVAALGALHRWAVEMLIEGYEQNGVVLGADGLRQDR